MRHEDYELLRYDIGFQIGRVSKSELNLLKGHDCTKSDRVKYAIAERILERLKQNYDIKRTTKPARAHSTTFGQPRNSPKNDQKDD